MIAMILVSASVLALFLSLGRGEIVPSAHAQSGCTTASLQGTFGHSFSGSRDVEGTPTTGVGLVTYDGKGNLTGADSVSVNGDITPERPITGTYTVNSFCAGTMTWITSFGPSEFTFVLVDGGRQMNFMQLTAGRSIVGSATKQ
jgi:hypothetical protein